MLLAWTKKRIKKSNSPTAVLELGFAIITSVIFFLQTWGKEIQQIAITYLLWPSLRPWPHHSLFCIYIIVSSGNMVTIRAEYVQISFIHFWYFTFFGFIGGISSLRHWVIIKILGSQFFVLQTNFRPCCCLRIVCWIGKNRFDRLNVTNTRNCLFVS